MSQPEAQIMQRVRVLCSTKNCRGRIDVDVVDVVDIVDILDIDLRHFAAKETVVLKRPCDGRPTCQELGV